MKRKSAFGKNSKQELLRCADLCDLTNSLVARSNHIPCDRHFNRLYEMVKSECRDLHETIFAQQAACLDPNEYECCAGEDRSRELARFQVHKNGNSFREMRVSHLSRQLDSSTAGLHALGRSNNVFPVPATAQSLAAIFSLRKRSSPSGS